MIKKLQIMMNELIEMYVNKEISFQEFQMRTDKIGKIIFSTPRF
jgi:hypothetical protein